MYSILKITDGTNIIDLLDVKVGYLLNDWKPSIAPFKGGGVWQNSPLVDGKRMAMRNFDNAVETFDVKLNADSQDDAITYIQNLVSILEKALAYWTTPWQHEPVWIEARGARETNSRYAVVKNYTLDGLNNPYAQPFFKDCNVLIDNFSIILERDHWLDQIPGTETCVSLSTTVDIPNSNNYAIDDYPVDSTNDDIETVFNEAGELTSISRVGTVLEVGRLGTDHHEVALRFNSVNVPKNATIFLARIIVVADGVMTDKDNYAMSTIAGAENVGNSTAITDANYLSKRSNQTIAKSYTYQSLGTWHTAGVQHTLCGAGNIVQELVNRNDWSSGNSMTFFVADYENENETSRLFASLDNTEYTEPILEIYYATSTMEVGQASTCLSSVYVGNCSYKSQISNIYRYNSGTVNYVDVLTDNKLFDMLNGYHYLYIGVDSWMGYGTFDGITFNLAVIAAPDAVFEYTYWNGVGFTALTVLGDYYFQDLGYTMIFWDKPDDWATTDINGVTGYWIRVQVTDEGGSPVDPVIVDETGIYAINSAFARIHAINVPGEITALSRIRILGYLEQITGADDFVHIGLRSLSRGTNFTPFINFSDLQNPAGISISDYLMVSDLTAPAEKCIEITTTTDITPNFSGIVNIDFDNTIAGEYRGSYHAYIRCKQTGGTAGDIGVRIAIAASLSSDFVYSQVAYTDFLAATGINMLDLGIVNFGSGLNITPTDNVHSARILLQYTQSADVSIVMRYYDLILFPIDEWSGIYTASQGDNPVANTLRSGYLLDIDATSSMRTQRAVLRESTSTELPVTDEYFSGEWVKQARGGPLLQKLADQRIWFLFASSQYAPSGYESYFFTKHAVRVYRNSRYLTMRGSA